ncbi:hypothetical protein B0H21DRAFT_227095 [Amylocystis lapponica]|nr:hypothetical protein B0H21DRAFT_227095 [Amylocystis lapponica]
MSLRGSRHRQRTDHSPPNCFLSTAGHRQTCRTFRYLPLYIRRGMLSHGHQYVAAYRGFQLDLPPTGFPSETNFGLLVSLLVFSPTHLLAVYEQAPNNTALPAERIMQDLGHGHTVMLFPVHPVVFLAYCSRAPVFPRSHPAILPIQNQNPASRLPTNLVRLPVVPDVLIRRFLYMHDVDKLHAPASSATNYFSSRLAPLSCSATRTCPPSGGTLIWMDQKSKYESSDW